MSIGKSGACVQLPVMTLAKPRKYMGEVCFDLNFSHHDHLKLSHLCLFVVWDNESCSVKRLSDFGLVTGLHLTRLNFKGKIVLLERKKKFFSESGYLLSILPYAKMNIDINNNINIA